MATRMHIDGLDELMGRLNDVESTLKKLNTTVEAVMREGQGVAATYPPATIANSPDNPSGRWYERGYGSKWETKNGVHGRRTSQTLSKKWYVRDKQNRVEIGNTAKYANYVHGDDALPIHKERGWKNLYEELTNKLPKLEQMLSDIVDRALEGK